VRNTLARPFVSLARLPLQRATGFPLVSLEPLQERALATLREKLERGEYGLRRNCCLCSDSPAKQDVVVLEQDRYGLPCQMVVCKACSLARTDPVLDDESLSQFYEAEFSLLHRGAIHPTARYLDYVLPVGTALHDFVARYVADDEIDKVMEVGCATGANLLPFLERGKSTIGFDYDENYMDFGRKRGLDVRHGDYRERVPVESQDLVILSHVLEHVTDPVAEMKDVISRVRAGGYLYVEVPGLFAITRRWKHCPKLYHQNDHIYHFHARYLRVFFESLGLDVEYCDEWCKALLRKPANWSSGRATQIPTGELDSVYLSVIRELKAAHLYFGARSCLVNVLGQIGLKKKIKQLRAVMSWARDSFAIRS